MIHSEPKVYTQSNFRLLIYDKMSKNSDEYIIQNDIYSGIICWAVF